MFGNLAGKGIEGIVGKVLTPKMGTIIVDNSFNKNLTNQGVNDFVTHKFLNSIVQPQKSILPNIFGNIADSETSEKVSSDSMDIYKKWSQKNHD